MSAPSVTGRCSAGAQTHVQPFAEGRHIFDVRIGAAHLARGQLRLRNEHEHPAGQQARQLARTAFHQEAAVMHEAQAVAPGRLIHVGRTHNDRYPLGEQADNQLPEVLPCHRIHARRGLIQQKQARAVDQRAGQPQFLFHPPRKLAGQPAFEAGQPHKVEQLRRAGSQLGATYRAHSSEEVQVLVDSQFLVQRKALRQIADVRQRA